MSTTNSDYTPAYLNRGKTADETESQASSAYSDLLSTEHSAIGAFDGFAGEVEEWGGKYVRVIVKVKRNAGLSMKDAALIEINW
jgi:hypothetical protein